MKINHLGNGVVQFDNALAASREDIQTYLNRLVINTRPQGYTEIDDDSLRNDGSYTFNPEQYSTSPSRYVQLRYDGMPEEDELVVDCIESALLSCLVEYCKLFPVAMETVKWKTHGYIIKYTPGQYIGPHSDCALPYDEVTGRSLNAFPLYNTITAGIILNDDYEGGALRYRPWGIVARPKASSAILYPSSYAGCHEVEPITSGTRFAYLAWFGHGELGQEQNYSQIRNLKAEVGEENRYQQFVPVGPLN